MPNFPATPGARRPRRILALMMMIATPSFLAAQTAGASDGVLEINQSCAVETGCFPGDSPGYPVTISGSIGRSFRLTSDLNVGNPDLDGIVISISRVEIDFNGFSLVGFSIGGGMGHGVTGAGTDGSFAGYTTLRRGSIRGMRSLGVALGGASDVRMERMAVEFNAGGGVALGDGAHVVESRFANNGSISFDGVAVGNRATIRGNTIHDSGGRGLRALDYAVIENNVVTESGGDGIEVGDGALVVRNASAENGGGGIRGGSNGTILHNTVSNNGGDGIRVLLRALVLGNSVNENGGNGIHTELACNVRSNTVTGNALLQLELNEVTVYSQNNLFIGGAGSGLVSALGVDAGDNLCGSSIGACP